MKKIKKASVQNCTGGSTKNRSKTQNDILCIFEKIRICLYKFCNINESNSWLKLILNYKL